MQDLLLLLHTLLLGLGLSLRLNLCLLHRSCLHDSLLLLLHLRRHWGWLSIRIDISWLPVLSRRAKVDLLWLRCPWSLRDHSLHRGLLRCVARCNPKLMLL
jgi:hypothetical protein